MITLNTGQLTTILNEIRSHGCGQIHFSPDKTHLLTFIEQFPNHFSFFLPTVKTTTERMYTCLSDHNIILMQEQNFTP